MKGGRMSEYTLQVLKEQTSYLGINMKIALMDLLDMSSLQGIQGNLQSALEKIKARNGRTAREYYSVEIVKEFTANETLLVWYDTAKERQIVIQVYKKGKDAV